MSLGLHFSLSDEEVAQLRDVSEAERAEYVSQVIEEEYFANQRERMVESDKAWDAMHRALTDGTLSWKGGDYPLNHLILGGELLSTNPDSIMVLKSPDQVRDVAAVLPGMTEEAFRHRYFQIKSSSYGMPPTEEDFQYTWEYFQVVHQFWVSAASEGRHVLFTADQ